MRIFLCNEPILPGRQLAIFQISKFFTHLLVQLPGLERGSPAGPVMRVLKVDLLVGVNTLQVLLSGGRRFFFDDRTKASGFLECSFGGAAVP